MKEQNIEQKEKSKETEKKKKRNEFCSGSYFFIFNFNTDRKRVSNSTEETCSTRQTRIKAVRSQQRSF